jgi:Uma2 family endonuclease
MLACMTAAASNRMSVDEWAALAEDVQGELVDGGLREEEVPSVVHECVVRWLILLLAPYFDAQGGQVFGSGVKLAVRPDRGRLADVVCFRRGRRPEPRGPVRVPPDIAVEVVSPAPEDERRDRIEKPDDYAAFGVKYYWLLDPELRSFEVWELDPRSRYVRVCSAVSGKVERVPGCEGLIVDLDALWAQLDELLACE